MMFPGMMPSMMMMQPGARPMFPMNMQGGPMNMYPRPMYQQMQGGRGPRGGPQRVKYSSNARNMQSNNAAPRAPQNAQPRPAAPAPLTAAALAEAPAERQK